MRSNQGFGAQRYCRVEALTASTGGVKIKFCKKNALTRAEGTKYWREKVKERIRITNRVREGSHKERSLPCATRGAKPSV